MNIFGLVCKLKKKTTMLYVFFLVIPRCLNRICRSFGTLCLFHLHRQGGIPTCLWRWNRQSVLKLRQVYLPACENETGRVFWNFGRCTYLPVKMKHTECFETSAGIPTCLWRWNRQSVPKRRHIRFRHRGITKKKTYNIVVFFFLNLQTGPNIFIF